MTDIKAAQRTQTSRTTVGPTGQIVRMSDTDHAVLDIARRTRVCDVPARNVRVSVQAITAILKG